MTCCYSTTGLGERRLRALPRGQDTFDVVDVDHVYLLYYGWHNGSDDDDVEGALTFRGFVVPRGYEGERASGKCLACILKETVCFPLLSL